MKPGVGVPELDLINKLRFYQAELEIVGNVGILFLFCCHFEKKKAITILRI